jgi:hypothetical protein
MSITKQTDRWLSNAGNVVVWALLAIIAYFSLEAVSQIGATAVAALFGLAGVYAVLANSRFAWFLRAPGNLLTFFVRFGA